MKRFFVAVAFTLIGVIGYAAITQTGYVKTRGRLGSNGKVIPGQRLANATVVLENGSSVVSNQSGDFTLSLPANKFYLKNVKKTGYIIVDPDMLSKQYVCSSNPLVLVLDLPTTLQDDRLASERRLRRNLDKKLHQREDELEALKEENKITQEQYRELLQKLYNDQKSNDKFIEEMVERYSRIDFDQLDDFQRQVAAYIQNGEITRADSLLRTKGSMDDREAEIRRIRNANEQERKELTQREANLNLSERNEAILLADFGADCYSHFELCKLKFDNDSAAYWIERRAMADTTNIQWTLDAGVFLKDYIACYDKVLEMYKRGLHTSVVVNGEMSKLTADLYNEMGVAYLSKGDYDKAFENLATAAGIREKIFEANHPDIALSYQNMGKLYRITGDYENALKHLKNALKIYENSNYDNYSYIANAYNNTGAVYVSLGDYKAANDYFERALKIQLEKLEPNNLNVGRSYNNIAMAKEKQGLYEQALDCYDKALNIFSQILSEKHPEMATIYNNMGVIHYTMGNSLGVIENFKKALDIQLEFFGENHEAVAASYNNLGVVYQSLKNYDDAIINMEQALRIMTTLFGENHASVATTYNNLGNLYRDKGDFSTALHIHMQALEIRKNLFSENHPDVASSYSNIGVVCFNQNKYAEAHKNLDKALNIRKGTLGERHPDVALNYNVIGMVYAAEGKYKDALEFLQKSLDIHKDLFGENHPATATSYSNIGGVYLKMESYEEALECFNKALELHSNIYGEDHPNTMRVKETIQQINEKKNL